MRHFIIFFALFLAAGCGSLHVKDTPKTPAPVVKEEPATEIPPIVVKPVEGKRVSLNWENTTEPHPERAPWSDYLLTLVDDNLASFEKAGDITTACPKFRSLTREEKKHALATLIVAAVYHESGYSPVSRMWEKKLGGKAYPIDPITGKYVYSEGLLQISYQDVQWAKYCKLNWSVDILLKETDPKKTILDPYINLHCGVNIMARQVVSKGVIFPKYGYWAVMNTGSKYSEVKDIIVRTKKYAPQCI